MAQHGADGVQTPGRSTRVSVRPRRPVRHHWAGGQARGVMGMQPLHISSQSELEDGRVSLLVPAGHAPTIPHRALPITTCRHRAKPNPWHVVSPPKGLLGGQQWRVWLEYRLPMTPWDAWPRVQHISHSSNPSRWTAYLNAESPVNWSFAAPTPLASGTVVAIEGRSLF